MSSLRRDRERKTRAEDRKYPVKNSFDSVRGRCWIKHRERERRRRFVLQIIHHPNRPARKDSLKASASRVESEQAAKQKERGDERAGEKQKVIECESKKQTNKKRGGLRNKRLKLIIPRFSDC